MAVDADGPDTTELAMVALYPRPEEAAALAVEGGLEPDDLHLTLVFLGDASAFDPVAAHSAVATVALTKHPLEGVVGGTGHFGEMEDGVPAILLPDVQGMSRLREDVIRQLAAASIHSPSEHGFLPHITQIYVESPDDAGSRDAFIGQELHFDSVSVVVGGRRQDYPLGGDNEMSANPETEPVGTVHVKIVPDFSEWDAEFAKRTFANTNPDWSDARFAAAAVEPGQKWHGILAFEGFPTDGDSGLKRFLMTPLGHRDLPLPLMAQFVTAEGHQQAGIAGRIDSIERIPADEFDKVGFDLPDDLPEGAYIHFGSGVFDTGEIGTEAARLVDEKMLRGVSVDLAGTQWVPLDAETFQELDKEEAGMERILRGVLAGGKNAVIAGATIVAHQAFGHALLDLVACAFASAEIRLIHEDDLVACAAGPLAPPAAWFEKPHRPVLGPVKVSDAGQVSGFIATYDCHMGYENVCMTAKPSRDGYARFHTGALVTAEGETVQVGRISVAPHAPRRMSPEQVMAYFSDVKKVAAFVRLYDFPGMGIYAAGATRSDAPPELLRDFLANPPSGEWRRGELLGISSVPLPGLPVLAPEGYFVAAADGGEGELEPELMLLPPVFATEIPELTPDSPDWPYLDNFATITAAQRRQWAREGKALPDGSFPITKCSGEGPSAENAIMAQGRSSGSQARVLRHIKKRVRAMGCSGGMFDDYR